MTCNFRKNYTHNKHGGYVLDVLVTTMKKKYYYYTRYNVTYSYIVLLIQYTY